jgi:hypothetical protein
LASEQKRIQELEAWVSRVKREEAILKNYCSLVVGRDESHALIDRLRDRENVEMICEVFGVNRFCYFAYRELCKQIDVPRMELGLKVNLAFKISRCSADSCILKTMLNEDGIDIGRFKVRPLVAELGLIYKQSSPNAYKRATVEQLDILSVLIANSKSITRIRSSVATLALFGRALTGHI